VYFLAGIMLFVVWTEIIDQCSGNRPFLSVKLSSECRLATVSVLTSESFIHLVPHLFGSEFRSEFPVLNFEWYVGLLWGFRKYNVADGCQKVFVSQSCIEILTRNFCNDGRDLEHLVQGRTAKDFGSRPRPDNYKAKATNLINVTDTHMPV